jgi:biotin operon repressor
MLDIMRSVNGDYAPATESFGVRLETFFMGLCIAIGDIECRPFSTAKIAAYLGMPRTTVIRRLRELKSWGLIDRQGRHYYLREKTLNSLIGMQGYQRIRQVLYKAAAELSILDTLPD